MNNRIIELKMAIDNYIAKESIAFSDFIKEDRTDLIDNMNNIQFMINDTDFPGLDIDIETKETTDDIWGEVSVYADVVDTNNNKIGGKTIILDTSFEKNYWKNSEELAETIAEYEDEAKRYVIIKR